MARRIWYFHLPLKKGHFRESEDEKTDRDAQEPEPGSARRRIDCVEEDVGDPGKLDPLAPRGGEGERILRRQGTGGDIQLPLLQVPPGVNRDHLEPAEQEQVNGNKGKEEASNEPRESF